MEVRERLAFFFYIGFCVLARTGCGCVPHFLAYQGIRLLGVYFEARLVTSYRIFISGKRWLFGWSGGKNRINHFGPVVLMGTVCWMVSIIVWCFTCNCTYIGLFTLRLELSAIGQHGLGSGLWPILRCDWLCLVRVTVQNLVAVQYCGAKRFITSLMRWVLCKNFAA